MGDDVSRAVTIASGLLSPAIGSYVLLKGRRQAVNELFFFLTFCLALWAIGDAMTVSASSLQGKVFWTRFQGLGELPLIPTFLVLALFFPRTRRIVENTGRAAAVITTAYAPFILGLIFLYATDLVYTEYMPWENIQGVEVARTPFFWFLTVLGFAYMGISSFLFARERLRCDSLAARRGLFFLSISPVPMLLANLVQNLRWSSSVTTPQASILTVALFAYGIMRYGLFLDSRLASKSAMAHATALTMDLALCCLLYAFFTYGLRLLPGWPTFVLFLVCAAPLVIAYPWEVTQVRNLISRYVYGSEEKAGRLLQDLSRSIRTVGNLSELSQEVVQVVRESMDLTVCALMSRDEEHGAYRALGFSSHPGHPAGDLGYEAQEEVIVREWKDFFDFEAPRGNLSGYWKVGRTVNRGRCPISYMDLGIMRLYGAGVVKEITWTRDRRREIISVPLEVGGERIGLLWLGGKLDRIPFSLEELDNIVALSAQVSVSLRNAQLIGEVQEKGERLRRLVQDVSTAQEEERIRISRELHDGLAPYFLDIIFHLDDLEKRLRDLPETGEVLEELRQKAREGMHDLRRLISDLRPSSLEVLGLRKSLSSYLERFGAETGLRTSFRTWGDLDGLDSLAETTLFRVAQEALSNVARHACAGEVRMLLKVNDGRVELTVEDDGVGFSWEDIRKRMVAGECLGLKGMMERAELNQGKFHITTSPGEGTRLVFDLPLRYG